MTMLVYDVSIWKYTRRLQVSCSCSVMCAHLHMYGSQMIFNSVLRQNNKSAPTNKTHTPTPTESERERERERAHGPLHNNSWTGG